MPPPSGLQQFKSRKSLFGKGGAFAPLLQEFLQEAMEAEMDAHLTKEKREKGNNRHRGLIVSSVKWPKIKGLSLTIWHF